MTNPKRSTLKWAATLVIALTAVGTWNYLAVHRHLASALADDPRNGGIRAVAHYAYFVNPRVLVLDLREVPGNKSALDVSRTLLQFSERIKNSRFDRVVLAYRGDPKFNLDGDYFQKLGDEYAFQNPVYTLRTLPENVYNLDGTPAFGTWTGGLLGVVGEQKQDLNEFHQRWYAQEGASE